MSAKQKQMNVDMYVCVDYTDIRQTDRQRERERERERDRQTDSYNADRE
jgi:hypothetical protein